MKTNSKSLVDLSISELRSATKALRYMLLLIEAEKQSHSTLWRFFFGFTKTRQTINELIVAFDSLADLKNEQNKNEDNTVNQK